MKRFRIISIFLALSAGPGWAVSSSKKTTVIETAPLKNMLGFFAMRGERVLGSDDAWAVFGEHATKPCERDGYLDRSDKLGGEYVWYPEVPNIERIFLGGGGSLAYAVVGYQKERDYVSDVRYSSEDRYDAWSSDEKRLSASGFAGYRLKLQKFFTVSLRYSVEKIILRSARPVDEDIKTYGFEPYTKPRESLDQSVTLYAGLILR